VNHQLGAADEFHEVDSNLGELRLVGNELVGQAVNLDGTLGNLPFWIDVGVEALAGKLTTAQLDAADLDDAVTGAEIQPGGFCVQNNLAQISLRCGRVPRRAAPARRRARSQHGRHGP